MYHSIEFTAEFTADLECSPKHAVEQLCVQKGSRLRAQVRPYVVEVGENLIEVADLFFEDGSTTRLIPFAYFRFLE